LPRQIEVGFAACPCTPHRSSLLVDDISKRRNRRVNDRLRHRAWVIDIEVGMVLPPAPSNHALLRHPGLAQAFQNPILKHSAIAANLPVSARCRAFLLIGLAFAARRLEPS
jgi:hypothetical protein